MNPSHPDRQVIYSRQGKYRLLLLVCLPLLSGMLLTLLLTAQTQEHELRKQADMIGSAISQQLSDSVAEMVVKQDVLGINVLLSELLNAGPLDSLQFASVYDANQQLIAQAGQTSDELTMFSRGISSQQSVVGHLQVGLNYTSITAAANRALMWNFMVYAVLLVSLGVLIWWYGDFIRLWLMLDPETRTASDTDALPATTQLAEYKAPAIDRFILVARITPQRLFQSHLKIFRCAIDCYNGKLIDDDNGDIAAVFNNQDHGLSAICAALLLQRLCTRLPRSLSIKLGIHWCEDDDAEKLSVDLKYTNYLTSISDNQLLVSRAAKQAQIDDPRTDFSVFSHGMLPEGQVFLLSSVQPGCMADIQSRADQILSDKSLSR